MSPVARKLFIYLKEIKVQQPDCEKQTITASGRKSLFPIAKWSVEPWQGEAREAGLG